VTKEPWKLLLWTAALASAPLLSPQTAAADDGGWFDDSRGAKLVDVDQYVEDDGDLRIKFEVENVGRLWARYEASAEVRAVFRCATRDGRLIGGQRDRLVLRDTLRDTDSFRVSRDGRIHGELVLNYEDLHERDFCRGNARPVLVRLGFNDVRLHDLTNDKIERLDRISRSFRDDDSWNSYDEDDRYDDGGWLGESGGGGVRIIVP